jgi:hypothetical protein
MNSKTRINFRERLFYRSCLKSSPYAVDPTRRSFSLPIHPDSRIQSQLHQLKQKLLHSALEETSEPGLFKRICGAANQAAEQAWNTSCPLLVFPCLFEDLVRIVCEQFQARNHELYGQTIEMTSLFSA